MKYCVVYVSVDQQFLNKGSYFTLQKYNGEPSKK